MPDLIDVRVRLDTALRSLNAALEHLPPDHPVKDKIVAAMEQIDIAHGLLDER